MLSEVQMLCSLIKNCFENLIFISFHDLVDFLWDFEWIRRKILCEVDQRENKILNLVINSSIDCPSTSQKCSFNFLTQIKTHSVAVWWLSMTDLLEWPLTFELMQHTLNKMQHQTGWIWKRWLMDFFRLIKFEWWCRGWWLNKSEKLGCEVENLKN